MCCHGPSIYLVLVYSSIFGLVRNVLVGANLNKMPQKRKEEWVIIENLIKHAVLKLSKLKLTRTPFTESVPELL